MVQCQQVHSVLRASYIIGCKVDTNEFVLIHMIVFEEDGVRVDTICILQDVDVVHIFASQL
jgi:hypothetical protein